MRCCADACSSVARRCFFFQAGRMVAYGGDKAKGYRLAKAIDGQAATLGRWLSQLWASASENIFAISESQPLGRCWACWRAWSGPSTWPVSRDSVKPEKYRWLAVNISSRRNVCNSMPASQSGGGRKRRSRSPVTALINNNIRRKTAAR